MPPPTSPARSGACLRRAALRITLAAALATVLGMPGVPLPPARAASCPAPGGVSLPAPPPATGDFVLTGRGFGHGLGLSQYGAKGAASLGCTAEEIVAAYYPTTTLTKAPGPTGVRVGLYPDRPGAALPKTLQVDAPTGTVAWHLRHADNTVTPIPTQAKGVVRTVNLQTDGTFSVLEGSKVVWSKGGRADRLELSLAGTSVRLPAKGRRYTRGVLHLSQPPSGTPALYVTLVLPTLEQYLYGVAEMPSSWPHQALRAQAIAARSFAQQRIEESPGGRSQCRCHLYDSTSDQVYTGFEKEDEGTNAVWGKAWRSAVDTTAERTIKTGTKTAAAFYASSHGGHSDSAAFVWGQDLPHVRPVDDSRWEAASQNPNSAWTRTLTAAELGAAFGIGTATALQLPAPKGVSGRVGDPARGAGGVVITGTSGKVTVSGDRLRSAFGLRSTLIAAGGAPVTPWGASDIPLSGDWNGDGRTTPGWYAGGQVYLRDALGAGPPHRSYRYGRSGDIPVVGDWNGDGRDSVAVVRDGIWHIRFTASGGAAERSFRYGRVLTGDYAISGDWDGDGVDSPGVVRGGEWHLRNELAAGAADLTFTYGRVLSGDVPLTGDWTGNGIDTPAIVRGSEWHVRHANRGGPADVVFRYGHAGDRPLRGDWSGAGRDGVGIVRSTTWHLRNTASAGSAQHTFAF